MPEVFTIDLVGPSDELPTVSFLAAEAPCIAQHVCLCDAKVSLQAPLPSDPHSPPNATKWTYRRRRVGLFCIGSLASSRHCCGACCAKDSVLGRVVKRKMVLYIEGNHGAGHDRRPLVGPAGLTPATIKKYRALTLPPTRSTPPTHPKLNNRQRDIHRQGHKNNNKR